MRTRLAWAAVFVAAFVLAGCIDTTVKVTVTKDGSGTIEKTIIVGKQLLEMMGGEAGGAGIGESMLSETSLREATQGMGDGVSFVSAQKVPAEAGYGYKAVYSFTDVNKLKLSQNPADDVTLPSMNGEPSVESDSDDSELYTFAFTKGSPAKLTITGPKVKESASSTAPAAKPEEQTDEAEQLMQMLRPLYADLRFSFSVEVKGSIVSTDATHVSGSEVTMMKMDLGAILTDDELFGKLMQGSSLTQSQEMLASIPGMKIETKPSVTITFR